jgi:hypothetical protein
MQGFVKYPIFAPRKFYITQNIIFHEKINDG